MKQQQSTTTTDTSTTLPTPKRSKVRQIFKWVIISLLVLCLFIVIALITLLNNQNAQQKLLTFVDQQLNDLTIGEISGDLQQGLQLDNVSYRTTGVDVKVAHLLLKLDTNCLWQANICINQLDITEPKIAIDTSQFSAKDQQDNSSSGLMMPVNIDLKQLNINQLDLKLDNQQILLEHFSTGLLATTDLQFNLLPTAINGLQIIETINTTSELPLTTESELKQQNTTSPTDWDALKQQLQKPLLNADSAFKLPLTIRIDDLTAKNWLYQKRSAKGDILSEIKMPTLALQANADQTNITLNKLTLVSNVLDLSAQGELQQVDHYPLQLTLNGKLHQQRENTQQKEAAITLPESQFSLKAQGNLYQQLTTDIAITGLADAKLTAQVALAEPKLPLMLNLAIQQAKYPLYLAKEANPATDQIRLVKTNLAITGNLLDYQANLQGNVEGMHSPTVDLDLKGVGSIDHFIIQQAALAGLNGNVDLQGNVSWRNGVTWDSRLNLQHLNVYRYFHSVDWLATLSGKLASSGAVNAEGWQVDIPLIDLNGSADNKPITIKGDLVLNNTTLLTSQLFDFHYGDNHLAFYGKLGKESLFNLTVDAPNLAGLYKGLDISAKGTAQITGDIQQPELDLDLTIPHLKLADLLLQKLVLNGKVQSDQQNIRGHLNLALNQLKYGENVQIAQLDLIAKGDEKQHSLSLRSQGKPAALNFNLTGHFDRTNQIWSGELDNTQLDTLIGKFNANKVIKIDYQNIDQQAKISAHCWQHTSLPLCFPQQLVVGHNGHIPFKLEKANLDFLKQFLTDNTKLNSQFNLDGEVNWYQDKPFDLTLNLESSHFLFTQKIDYHQFNLELNKLSLESKIKDNKLTAKSEITIRDNGSLNSNLTLNDIVGTPTLGGTLQAENLKLSLIKQLLNPGDNVDGNLNANLSLSGNLTTPQLHGKLSLTQLTSSMPALPFNITDGFANLVFNGNRSTLNGEIVTQDGTLRLKGDSDWRVLNNWYANLSATSDKFSLTIPDLAKLTIVPDIHLHAQPNHLNIEGKVDVPFANIEIEQLPESAIGVSSDEVILEQKPKLSTKQKLDKFSEKTGTVLSTDIMINLGQRVRVSAYGLKSQLEGVLNVRQQDNQLGLFGQIHLLNGRYASFGQDLLIRKGEIIFSGLPSQPTLNIEAIRNPNAMETNTVTAGIRVSGLAESPTIQVFSEPSMSQDNALSYLLTGRALSSENSGSGASLGAALISMSLSKTGKMVGQIGETFGIKSLNLETQGLGDQSQVVVSGYLTPRLQVKYGVGLFEPLAELTLRYRLLPKLYLQSVSGTSQAVDLLYQFEH
ncbi:translocation/assembly module TamB domain-containing protein [Gallibacterium melopsittaci]|uniref:Translocation/assembly module TamB domain-containing protein n=1 Tax=Gallibacterium melopsittaci TaxID=516063 RepID=A0ABV6HUU4_9PAST